MSLIVEKMYDGVPDPAYMSEGAVAFDIAAWLPEGSKVTRFVSNHGYLEQGNVCDKEIVIIPAAEGLRFDRGDRFLIPTGLRVIVPAGYELQIRLRSSAIKTTLRLSNQVGTVDQDYRGELFIPLENISPHWTMVVHHKERVAQAVLAPITKGIEILPHGVRLEDVQVENAITERGAGGFGSTGQ